MPRLRLFVWLLIAPIAIVCDASNVVVVCPSDWKHALSPWLAMRQAEGLSIQVIVPMDSAEKTASSIGDAADESTQYVMLVGDCATIGQTSGIENVPTFYLPAMVTTQYGSTPTFPSDLPYGDLDQDGNVDAAVGRLPVRSSSELANVVKRILEYENSNDFGPWRRSLQLTGGVGGFGGLVDSAIESVTRSVLTGVLPADAKPLIAYASPGHVFCPGDASFCEAVMKRYQTGARFWVYAGHGSVDRLDFLKRSEADAAALHGKPAVPVWSVESLLSNATAGELQSPPSRASIGVLLACFAGAYDAPGDCLAERMILAPGGPIAVIASSRLSMPYGNARVGLGLLESVYQDRAIRLGDAMVGATRRLQANPEKSAITTMVDGFAVMLSPAGTDLAVERREHGAMYGLLGDPTLRLHPPQPMPIEVANKTPANAPEIQQSEVPRTITVTLTSPIAGSLTLTVDRPLGDTEDPHGATIASVEKSVVVNESLVAEIPIPNNATGPVIIRGFVAGQTTWASAAVRTLLR